MKRHTIRLASYNIRKARGLDQRRKPGRVLDVINGLGADIVLLQEADRRLGERKPAIPRRMIEEETDFELIELAHGGVSLGWHGNAVLARRGIKPDRISLIDLPGLEPRGAVRLDFAGGQVSLLGIHLGLRRRDRAAQIRHLIDAVSDAPHVMMAGDFNEWSKKRGLEAFKDRFNLHAPGRSFHASRPIAALDRVALSRDIELRDAGVEEGALAKRASDHLPIWTDLALPDGLSLEGKGLSATLPAETELRRLARA